MLYGIFILILFLMSHMGYLIADGIVLQFCKYLRQHRSQSQK